MTEPTLAELRAETDRARDEMLAAGDKMIERLKELKKATKGEK